MNKKTRNQVASETIGIGALAQISRNKKINDIGGVFGICGLIILIGELIKFPIKWLIVKPFMFTAKIFWIGFKYMVTVGAALSLALCQYAYKGIIRLIKFSKAKYNNSRVTEK
ncbi:hypothetical protein [Clostridium tagluense]|uniref:hypothetical protein n=1 Tax=Clostridium tagluense TaxID=360422 RepID=UPI001C6DDF4D|nr:hypothetical protein [Clostridium tagluense]MBW9158871.1 hypothetical protein [Clostridium tagluense]WLC67151.1 hypothetical protein KTC93_08225 [Clostridium tagluense]